MCELDISSIFIPTMSFSDMGYERTSSVKFFVFEQHTFNMLQYYMKQRNIIHIGYTTNTYISFSHCPLCIYSYCEPYIYFDRRKEEWRHSVSTRELAVTSPRHESIKVGRLRLDKTINETNLDMVRLITICQGLVQGNLFHPFYISIWMQR